MRHNVDVYKFIITKDDYGSENKEWIYKESIKAQVIKRGGNVNQDQSNKIDSDISIEVQCWNLENIDYSNQLEYDDIMYEIDFIDKGYDERKLKIICNKIRW